MNNLKSLAGEEFLLLDCTAKARRKESFFADTRMNVPLRRSNSPGNSTRIILACEMGLLLCSSDQKEALTVLFLPNMRNQGETLIHLPTYIHKFINSLIHSFIHALPACTTRIHCMHTLHAFTSHQHTHMPPRFLPARAS